MKLAKEIKMLGIFSFASGAMISSGLFVLPGLAHAQAGPAVIFSYFLAGLLALTGMLSISEMATAMPKAGGDYYFISRSMGSGVGTVAGLLSWFSLSLKSAFALVGMSAFTIIFFDVPFTAISVALCIVFVLVNLFGVKGSAKLQVGFVMVMIALLIAFIVQGLPNIEVTNLSPFAPKGNASIFYAAGFVFVSYGGLLKVSSVAEEVYDYRRIPLGLGLSLLVVSILYTLAVTVTVGVMPADQLDQSLTPLSDAAGLFMGRPGVVALSVAAILAFVSTANAGIMAASRYLLALSRDGLLPQFLSKIDDKHQAPRRAVVATGVFMVLVLLLDLEFLVKAASTVLLMTFLLANLSVIILRESHVQNYQPSFRCPGYPITPALGMLGCAALILIMGLQTLLLSLLLVVGGFAVYWFYGRVKAEQEYALLHLIERVTSMDLSEGLLETELKEVIRQKDQLCVDRFDAMIETCPILNLEEPMALKELFDRASAILAPQLGIDESCLSDLLYKRELMSSTAIGHGVAIPHVTVAGEGAFHILPIRCKGKVHFIHNEPPVHTVFVMVGTADQKNFHLRALSAIAQVTQGRTFRKRWHRAKNEEALRHLILLGKRTRHCETDQCEQCPKPETAV